MKFTGVLHSAQGCPPPPNMDAKRHVVTKHLIAAVEMRVSHVRCPAGSAQYIRHCKFGFGYSIQQPEYP